MEKNHCIQTVTFDFSVVAFRDVLVVKSEFKKSLNKFRGS